MLNIQVIILFLAHPRMTELAGLQLSEYEWQMLTDLYNVLGVNLPIA